MICKKLIIHGDVQGVGFRMACVREAKRIANLQGWVKNTTGGAVEVVVQGNPTDVAQLKEWCKRGPPAAQVSHISESEYDPISVIGFNALVL